MPEKVLEGTFYLIHFPGNLYIYIKSIFPSILFGYRLLVPLRLCLVSRVLGAISCLAALIRWLLCLSLRAHQMQLQVFG